MTARPLNAVLRALADTGPPETDADLLRRFVATRDDEAFATLVKRHGRLVWAVCRHLTRSDAEADDAFQATFLVLVRNAAVVKDAAKLSAWLHGVAYKVCGKSRLSAKRRSNREQVAASRELNGQAVPDSAWDRALAAVHEEVSGLPDTLRVPFVLCCLEGKGQTEAAEQLGWKLGTLSGRLTRAKDAVLARLSARGLTLGVLASVGLAVVPSDVSAKAVGLGLVGSVIPGSVLQLSTGVIGMSVNKVKLLAAGVLAACGLAVSGGASWVASAEAQTSTIQSKLSPADRVKQLEAELEKAKSEAAKAAADAERAKAKAAQDEAMTRYKKALADHEQAAKEHADKGEKGEKAPKVAADATNATKNNDYQFVVVKPMPQREFMQFLQEHEDKGWIFSGTAPMDDPKQTVWVFRRPKGGVYYAGPSGQYQFAYPTPTPAVAPKADPTIAPPAPPAPPVPGRPGQGGPAFFPPTPPAPPAPSAFPAQPTPPSPVTPPTPPTAATPAPAKQPTGDEAAALEDAIKKLQDRLAEVKKGKSKERK